MTQPKTSQPKSPKTPEPTPAAPQVPSQAASYMRLLAFAQQLPIERVQACRIDVNLIFANVQTGLAAVLPHLDRLKVELPLLPSAQFADLSELAGALLYATAQLEVSATPIKREQMDKMLARLHALREPMLLVAEALALLGFLPGPRVEQIRSGKGHFDAAQDGIALSDLYREFAAVLHNKHPFTEEQFTEIAELGQALLQVITPDGARTMASRELAAATEARDRLYTLLYERHQDLFRAAAYLFGRDSEQLVPALGARKGKSRSEATAPAPAATAPAADAAAAGHA